MLFSIAHHTKGGLRRGDIVVRRQRKVGHAKGKSLFYLAAVGCESKSSAHDLCLYLVACNGICIAKAAVGRNPAHMQYRTLGRTGLEVSTISMGTWKSFDVRGPKEVERVHSLVTEALRCGVNLFDTAPMYGTAEDVLGEVLKGRRKSVVVATKVLAYDQCSARKLIEQSFRKLQVDVVDLMQIHNMSAWQEVTPILEEYQAKGRIRFLGITDYRTSMFPEMMQAMRTEKFDTIQIPYNLGDREAEKEIIPLARQLNLGVLVMTPIAPIFDRNKLLQPLERQDLSFLSRYGVATPGQALLKYALANPDVTSLLPATSRLERVTENAQSADGPVLSHDVRRRLEGMLS